MSQYSSILYKADQRTGEQSESSGRLSTFDKAGTATPERAYGSLVYLDDVFLAPRQERNYENENSLQQIIIPVTGTLCYGDMYSDEKYIASEEICYPGRMLKSYRVRNPYPDQGINYLRLGLRTDAFPHEFSSQALTLNEFNKIISFKLNKFVPGSFGGIGVFKGRAKSNYTLKDTNNSLFAYVINGAFEMENRLIEHRDGLVMWDIRHVEFEALSEFAILLLLEVESHKK